MIVACSECNKRYQVDDGLIHWQGRQVRCAACGHVWLQTPDVVDEVLQNPHIQDVRDRGKAKSKLPALLGWGSFLLCAAAFGGYMLLEGGYLSSHFSQIPSLQNILGMHATVPGEGLALTNTRVDETSEGYFVVKGDVSNISDQVRGLSALRVKALGQKECEQLDENGECILKEWQLELDRQSLPPGEQLSFESTPYPLIKGTEKVGISF